MSPSRGCQDAGVPGDWGWGTLGKQTPQLPPPNTLWPSLCAWLLPWWGGGSSAQMPNEWGGPSVMGSVFIPSGFCNRIPQAEWLRQEVDYLTVLEAGSLRSKCQQGQSRQSRHTHAQALVLRSGPRRHPLSHWRPLRMRPAPHRHVSPIVARWGDQGAEFQLCTSDS